MQRFYGKYFLILLFLLPLTVLSQTNSWSVKNEELQYQWQIQSSDKVPAEGDEVSTIQFKPVKWYEAKVPNSTLGTLVDDGVFKNIFFNRNLEKIPDSLFNVPWWYRRTFIVNNTSAGQVYRLRFNGISYRADVWLNGKKIAPADSIKGSFRQFIFNITPYIKKVKTCWH